MEFLLALPRAPVRIGAMFSHIVIFWTDSAQPNAADELIAGANKYLKAIPGVLQFHVGKMSPSPRPVVDQTYQVALNLIFPQQAGRGRLSGASAASGIRRAMREAVREKSRGV